MRSILYALAMTCVAGLEGQAAASTSAFGKPSSLITNRAGRFFFNVAGAHDARPGCAVFDRWVINAATDEGKAMMSLILTVKAQGKRVVVHGSGDCQDWPDTEAIAHIEAED